MAEHLLRVEGGEIPDELPRLFRVPGLGEYSARAILSFGFGVAVAVVDANVERILHRLFWRSMPPRPSAPTLQAIADTLLPKVGHRDFNFGLLDLGALVCRYVDPRCHECPLNALCDYYDEQKVGSIAEQMATYDTGTGSKLRRTRKGKGVSLAHLAARSGVSKLTIIRAEGGKSTPKATTVDKLADALGVDPAELQ